MIRLFQRLLLFSGLQKKRLIRSFLAYLVSSFFEMIPIMAILTVLTGILKQLSGDVMPESTIWISLGIMIVSIVGRIVFVNLSANARTLGSFAFGSEKRMEIGERLKLSEKTVATYKYRLFEKLAIDNVVTLAHLATAHGLMEKSKDAALR